MKKLLKYKNGDEYVTGGIVGIEPNGVAPVEEFDLSGFSDQEYKDIIKNKKNKKLLKKARKING